MKYKIRDMGCWKFVLVFVFMLSFVALGSSLKNPSQVYCTQMNYSFAITNTPDGEVGLCYFPDGTYFDAWDFYQGLCGTEHSFCSLNGYGVESSGDMVVCNTEYPGQLCTACILDNGTHVSVDSLMSLDFREGTCGDLVCALGETYENCPVDCPSGSIDMYCDGVEDGLCDPDCEKEQDIDCLPVCGNELCEDGEDYENCPEDCEKAIICGDGVCEGDETLENCNMDCKKQISCGNGVCDEKESYQICPEDCPSGHKDNFCDGITDGVCDPDCKKGEDEDCQMNRVSRFWVYGLIILAVLLGLILFIRKFRVSKK